MITALKNWKGRITINGQDFDSYAEASKFDFKTLSDDCSIILHSDTESRSKSLTEALTDTKQYQITVKKYMTQKSNPGFDFMAKFNNDNPMPYRIMVGTKEKETPGMVYMKLHAEIIGEKMTTCMCCGRILTNPVSQYFGIGPECGSHNYINPFDSEAELREAVDAYKKQLMNVTWEGWIIRSSIIDCFEVTKDGSLERCIRI